MVKNSISVIIQARYSSTRYEGKILDKIGKNTILEILIKRLKKSKKIKNIIVACSTNQKDKMIINLCKKINIKYFAGSEENVQDRFFEASKKFNIKNILRVTADCPLIDVSIIDKMIDKYNEGYDYVSNTINPTMPDGFDVEIFKFKILKDRINKKKINDEKEHVTSGILKNLNYKRFNFELSENFSNLRLTLDTKYDFKIIKKVLEFFKNNIYISLDKILNLYRKNSEFFEKNANTKRNEGTDMNLGQKYWIRAQDIIPGGTLLFSKNPDLHLPKLWPVYFSKLNGCKIWDLNKKKFYDMHLMGVGTNTLGYCNKSVDKKVLDVIKQGNMSTLNSIEEIQLSEKLIDLHPWAEMSRFTRSGGEANAVAIRIARAYINKDNIAICGYHGWHDWYLSTNINNKNNLDEHLMQNLPIKGVPKNLKNTVFPFEYNNFYQLEKIVKSKNIGIIKMEVQRNVEPKNNFLQKVRKLASSRNIILIFDECTSGFREHYGGIHMKYKVFPDIAIFGKALGNGYAINAIIGKKDIMKAVNDTFISSTFWTERIGPAAALQTLKIMKEFKSWEVISNIGKKIKNNWKKIAKQNHVKINVFGLDAIPNFSFNSKDHNRYKTFISQEMIKNNILASNVVYSCISHDNKILEKYFNVLNDIFYKIGMCENNYENINNLLKVPECIKGIRSK